MFIIFEFEFVSCLFYGVMMYFLQCGLRFTFLRAGAFVETKFPNKVSRRYSLSNQLPLGISKMSSRLAVILTNGHEPETPSRENSLPWQRSGYVLVNDQPLPAAFLPDRGVAAVNLHRAARLRLC